MEEKSINEDLHKEFFNTNEINRLQRAAKNKDKKEIEKWGEDFSHRLNEFYYKMYFDKYMGWLNDTMLDIEVAICYLLHFATTTRYGNKRLESLMNDLKAVIEGFYSNQFSRESYMEELENDGIKFRDNKKLKVFEEE